MASSTLTTSLFVFLVVALASHSSFTNACGGSRYYGLRHAYANRGYGGQGSNVLVRKVYVTGVDDSQLDYNNALSNAYRSNVIVTRPPTITLIGGGSSGSGRSSGGCSSCGGSGSCSSCGGSGSSSNGGTVVVIKGQSDNGGSSGRSGSGSGASFGSSGGGSGANFASSGSGSGASYANSGSGLSNGQAVVATSSSSASSSQGVSSGGSSNGNGGGYRCDNC